MQNTNWPKQENTKDCGVFTCLVSVVIKGGYMNAYGCVPCNCMHISKQAARLVAENTALQYTQVSYYCE